MYHNFLLWPDVIYMHFHASICKLVINTGLFVLLILLVHNHLCNFVYLSVFKIIQSVPNVYINSHFVSTEDVLDKLNQLPAQKLISMQRQVYLYPYNMVGFLTYMYWVTLAVLCQYLSRHSCVVIRNDQQKHNINLHVMRYCLVIGY